MRTSTLGSVVGEDGHDDFNVFSLCPADFVGIELPKNSNTELIKLAPMASQVWNCAHNW